MDANDENKMNEIFSKLESNNIISYKYSKNNKIYMNFELNEVEKECFSIIMNILKKNNLNSVISRVAGGWVRDKLLGKESDDIDISLNDIEASKLVFIINEELNPGKYKLGIIPKNPSKGKNVEVATTNILNTVIDFVNLRCDEKTKMPSPLTDSELRDISINSLFYNINEQKVEDFTQRGITDLEKGVINTPVEPEVAILNDSFITLRMLRFAIKYKFRINDNINNYLEQNNKIILDNFYKKVSRERIEKELTKIFLLDNSQFVVAYLYSFNLLDSILLIKDCDDKNNYDYLNLKITNLYILGEYLYKKGKIFEIEIDSNNFNKVDYSFFLLTLYFRNKKDVNNLYLNQKILRHTYKTSNERQLENKCMCRNIDELLSLINEEKYERYKVGKILKRITYKNILPILYGCIAYEYNEKINLNDLLFEINENVLQNIINKVNKFFNYIKNEDMLHIDRLKPLFKGKELFDILPIITDKVIKPLLDYLIDEQIKNPKLNKEHAIELLSKKLEEFPLNKEENDNQINIKTKKKINEK